MKVPTIDRYIKKVLGTTVKENHQKAVILYTLRLCNHVEFKNLTLDITSGQRKALRMGIRQNANLTLYYKIQTFLSLKNGKNEYRKKLDYNTIKLLKKFGLYKRCMEAISKIEIFNPEYYKQHCGKIVSGLRTYIAKYVSRKMRFIAQGHNLDITDFTSQLIYNAVQAYYNEIPFKSGLYLENSIRTKIHNDGVNLILHYTREKNKRMLEEDGRYVGTTVSITQGEDSDTWDLLERTNLNPEPYKDVESNDLLHNIGKRFIKPNGERGKKYEALYIMSLYDNESFINWYNEKNNTKYETTEDIYDKIDNAINFREVVRNYFKATENSWNSFLDEVKKFL